MLNFTFHNPTKLIFGKAQIQKLSKEIPLESKVLLLYGGGSIKTNGVYESVKKALEKHKVFEFGGIEPNPSFETLMRAVELARKEKIDFLLAVGGGSVVDGTKFVAIAVPYEGKDPWDFLCGKAVAQKALPIGCVLTLPATGSESNGNSVITRYETKDKLHFSSPLVYPRFAVLDPETTYSLSPKQTANGIVDAFVHVAEQYLTYNVNSPLQDRLAESLLKTLIEEAPKVMKDSNDYESRANIMLSATLALNGLVGSGVAQDWATHMIGHEITGAHGLDHAVTLAIVLPSLLQEKREQKREKLLQYARRVWELKDKNEDELITEAISKTREFFESLGIKTRLSDYGINKTNLEKIIEKLIEHNMVCLGEKGDITPEVSRKILEASI